MFDRGHGRFNLVIVEGLIGNANVLDQEAEWNLFSDFQSALDFIHGFDAAGPVRGGDVDGRCSGASPFVICVERRVDRIQWNAAAFKPVGDFAYVLLAVGVIDVLTGSENFDRLCASPVQAIENARMQAFFDMNE